MITQHTRAAQATMPARVLAGALTAALIGLTLACGDEASDGPADTSAPPDASLTATASAASDAATEETVDLADLTPVSIVYGAGEGDLPSDQPALASGDFDGDGVSDLAIGARFADPPSAGTDAGSVYLIRGASDLPGEVDLGEAQQDLVIIGPHAGANFGFSTVAADLNGDGADDLAIGAAFARPDGVDTGATYVFFGPLALDGSEIAATSADVVISGESASGFFGDSLAAGDVNADGVRDLIIGATFDSSGRSGGARGGAVYVFSGRSGWPAQLSASDADVSIFGEDDLDELGDFVASGDVNGDGRDDIIATAEAADGPQNDRQTAAHVYVIFGGEDLDGAYDVADDADVVIYGARAHDTLGFALATGDLDGDGTDDLAMGARLAEGGGLTRAGVVYVLPGGDLPAEIDLASPPDWVRAFHGASSGDLLGSLVHIADVDGDGRNELLTSARLAGPADRARAGAVYIVSGLPDAGVASVVEAASTTVLGRSGGEGLGGNVLAADLDGDGRPDLVIVAENASGPGDSRPGVGRVYIISVP